MSTLASVVASCKWFSTWLSTGDTVLKLRNGTFGMGGMAGGDGSKEASLGGLQPFFQPELSPSCVRSHWITKHSVLLPQIPSP